MVPSSGDREPLVVRLKHEASARRGRTAEQGEWDAKIVFVALLTIAGAGQASAQDTAAGEKVFGVCKTCHLIGENAKNVVGPVLNGIIGRKAGTVTGYSYPPPTRTPESPGMSNLPRIHQGSEGEGSGHQDDLVGLRTSKDQRSGRVPQTVRRGRKEEVARRPPLYPPFRKARGSAGRTRTPMAC